MNLVIPYTDDGKDGFELRYAIRSMEMFFKDLHQVILVGDKPSWFTGIHIQASDIEGRKEYSVYLKLKKVEGVVLYSMDDVYALKPFDTNLPNYYFGTCREMSQRVTDRRFKDLFGQCLPEWKSFEVHSPMVIDTRLLDYDNDCLLKTTYANRLKLPGVEQIDCKIKNDLNYGEVKERIKDKPFWSTHDNADKPGISSMLKRLYPKPSRNEYIKI